MSTQPIKLTIAALGGQGGGVLSNWLVEVAEANGYLGQSTSVPGVAQRTGATIYYLEFFPRAVAEHAGREPILALMPMPGDVDCVVASELVEAGRVIQRGLVTPQRTVLIASSHRAYTISERSAMGDGKVDSQQLVELACKQAKRLILFDMEQTAERHRSVISSVLLGAIAASGVLPFRRESFEAAIRNGGIAVQTNLAAFAGAFEQAAKGLIALAPAVAKLRTEIPANSGAPQLQRLLERLRSLPALLQPLALEGVRRTIDFQDPDYAAQYLERLEKIVALDARCAPSPTWSLSEATARSLALWMTFEDTIRVADLKTRGTRFARVRGEIKAEADQIIGVTEFMKPRIEELVGTLPAAIGQRLRSSTRARRLLSRFTSGRYVRTSTIRGFILLRAIAFLQRWRRGTLRFREENERIEQWLGVLERLATRNYTLAVEAACAQRLVKGYGETNERGWRNFSILMGQLDRLAMRTDGAAIFARLQSAASSDEGGVALAAEIARLAD